MKIIEELIRITKKYPVEDVRVGVSWTAVLSKYCGVANTFSMFNIHGNYTKDWGKLTEKDTRELAEYVKSWNLIEASIGVAAINSTIKPKGKKNINMLELLPEISKNKKVTMIGRFPKVDAIKEVSKEFWILEINPFLVNPKHNIFPEFAAEQLIPKSDVLIITSSTIINKTIDRYLKLVNEDSYVVLMGPTTPLHKTLFDYGIDILAGLEVLKPKAILEKISQSAGMISSRVCEGEVRYRVLEK